MQIVSRIIKMDKNVPYLKVNSIKKKHKKNALGDKVVVPFFSS